MRLLLIVSVASSMRFSSTFLTLVRSSRFTSPMSLWPWMTSWRMRLAFASSLAAYWCLTNVFSSTMRPPRNLSFSNVFLEEESVVANLYSMTVVSSTVGHTVGSAPQAVCHHDDGGDVTEGGCTHVE